MKTLLISICRKKINEKHFVLFQKDLTLRLNSCSVVELLKLYATI